MSNKQRLLKKITRSDGQKIAVVPIDYGVYKGPIEELVYLDRVLPQIVRSNISALLLHKGMIKHYHELLAKNNFPYFLHLTASTGLGNPMQKVLVGAVSEASDFNAIGVSMSVYLGNAYEPEMLKILGEASKKADKCGLLLYAMMYVANNHGKSFKEDTKPDSIKWAARVGFEIGADIIEIRYPDTPSRLSEIKSICPVPLLVADSAKYSEQKYQQILHQCVAHNLDGVSISRRILNVKDTKKVLKQTERILFSNSKVIKK